MKMLRADRYTTVPWRNGGGITREIAVHEDASRHDDFLWRLTIATVAKSGAFSRFDGVDRSIALVDGQGMVLRSPSTSTIVAADAPPFSFNGEAEIFCELIGGPTIDLNAMSRRGFFRHILRREQFVGWTAVNCMADQTFVVSNAYLEFSWLGRDNLRPLDTVADLSPGTTLELYSDRAAEIFVVELMSE